MDCRVDWQTTAENLIRQYGKPAEDPSNFAITLEMLAVGRLRRPSTGYLMISPKMATDRRAGGKRRLIRKEGFASRISKNARPHDPGGGGGGQPGSPTLGRL